MKKKLIGIVIIMIIATNALGNTVTAENKIMLSTGKIDIQSEIHETCCEDVVNYENKTQLSTVGPISMLFDISKIIIIDGPILETLIIRILLNSLKAYLFLPNLSIPVRDLMFVVKYKINIPQMPVFQGFSYNTTVTENGATTSYTGRHILVATGFEGTFGFSRGKPLQLTPANFWFNGTCDDIIVAA
ncbi:MAG: hypothetical protein ACOC80_06775 [Petrotogales bacterium]